MLTGAHVARITLEGSRATGVEYVRNGQVVRVRAAREVVLCGVHTTHRTCCSCPGIGPAAHLESVGVKVLHDLPGVGENLIEHPNLLNIYELRGKLGFTKYSCGSIGRRSPSCSGTCAGTGRSRPAGSMGNLIVRSNEELDRPDIQIVIVSVHQHARLWFPMLTPRPVYAITARIGVLHPKSRGWVRLRSADPFALPRFRFNMLTEQADVDSMVQGAEVVPRALRADAFARGHLERAAARA